MPSASLLPLAPVINVPLKEKHFQAFKSLYYLYKYAITNIPPNSKLM